MMDKMSMKMKLGLGFGILLLILTLVEVITYTSSRTSDELSVDAKNMFRENMDKLEPMLQTEKGKKVFGAAAQSQKDYLGVMEQAARLRRAGKTREATDLIFSPPVSDMRNAMRDRINELIGLIDAIKQGASEQQNAGEARAVTLTLTLGGLGMLLGLATAFLIARSVASAVARMGSMIQEIAANNLTVEDVQVLTQDDLGKACNSLNGMKNNLHQMIEAIASTAEHMAAASEEISSSATQAAQGADTQKDQTTQVATAMQEMSSTVLQVSDNSSKAAEAAHQAAEKAKHGG